MYRQDKSTKIQTLIKDGFFMILRYKKKDHQLKPMILVIKNGCLVIYFTI